MGKMNLVVVVMVVSLMVPMIMGELDLQGMLNKAKEAGISTLTIQEAANSDEAKQAIQDGTAQQALNDAKDAMSDSNHGDSPWSDWVKSNIGLAGGPAPSQDDSESSEVGDIELAPSDASASASPEGSAPSPLLSSLWSPSPSPILSPLSTLRSMLSPTPAPSPSLSPSPSPSAEAPADDEDDDEAEDAPASAPSLPPESE